MRWPVAEELRGWFHRLQHTTKGCAQGAQRFPGACVTDMAVKHHFTDGQRRQFRSAGFTSTAPAGATRWARAATPRPALTAADRRPSHRRRLNTSVQSMHAASSARVAKWRTPQGAAMVAMRSGVPALCCQVGAANQPKRSPPTKTSPSWRLALVAHDDRVPARCDRRPRPGRGRRRCAIFQDHQRVIGGQGG